MPVADLLTELLTSRYDVPVEDIAPDRVLEDLSLDSLAIMEMSLALEKQLGVVISEGVLTTSQTVAEAVAAVTALRP